ncbi:autophagy-related protein 27 [[Candida] railenensis]|uniref:Autophagy-related protein 27 n=1 Tax=[Candida] railenensis TaxID=45579 RepID=A0A9P0VXU8_9ASCO|nr:autophagy-related protein 27 [[Candida] railenensis]
MVNINISVGLLTLASILQPALAGFDCSASEVSDYNLELLKGVHKYTEEVDTPPTKKRTTWYVAMCSPMEDKACPKDSDICGLTEVLINDKYVLTEVKSFDNSLSKTYKQTNSGLEVVMENLSWGPDLYSASLKFVCSEDDKDVEVELIGTEFSAVFNGPAGCAKKDGGNKDKPKTPPPKNDDKGESWGWFTWIFIFLVLFLSIYIIGGAWFQYHKSNSIDFQSALREVLENFVDLLRGLPNFIKEIMEKVTGNNTRGEYSAV